MNTLLKIITLFFLIFLINTSCTNNNPYKSFNSDKTTQQKLQQWQNNKFGMFIHWGLYSIPAGIWKGENIPFYSEQIMNHARIPVNEYEKLAENFNPTDWNADSIVKLAKETGMKYIVFTTKHHDGFCMFKTNTTPYNIVDATPFGRDVLKELAESCKKYDIKLGLYYSFPDWHFPNGIPRLEPDTTSNCTQYVNQLYSPLEIITPKLEKYIISQLKELLTNYGTIETIWFDMGLVTNKQSYLFRKIVKNLQPKCLINGRIMNNAGDYLTLPDNGNISDYTNVAWDNPSSLYNTWGYRSWQNRINPDIQSNIQIKRLMRTISNGGVFLLNIGPDGNGKIIDYEKIVLQKIGKWVKENSNAIYNTLPSPFDKLENACCTQNANKLYITIFDTTSHVYCHNLVSEIIKAYELTNPQNMIQFKNIDQGIDLLCKNKQTENGTIQPKTIVLEFADSNIVIEHKYIFADKDNVFSLTENNAFTHAAIDAKSYVTTQQNSWKSWFINIEKAGNYNVFIIYTPEYINKSYTFKCGTDSIMSILPGVDEMKQTSFVGNIKLPSGKQEFILSSTNKCTALESLGIKIEKILLIPST